PRDKIRIAEARWTHSRTDVLDENAFLHSLRLETKRTVRSSNSFMLLLLDVEALLCRAHSDRLLRQIRSTVEGSIRDTDTLGWYDDQKRLGVIFTSIGRRTEEDRK